MARPPHSVSIGLLGRFEVTVDDRPSPAAAWGRRHAAALVKVLALSPQRTLHREQVFDLLWPDLAPGDAAPRLHKAAHFARRACGADRAVELGNEVVSLFADCDVTVDALAFETAAAAALADRDRAAAAAAADSYIGDLLPEDLYEEWAEDTRERLRLLHVGVLRLAQRWEILVAADPTDEEAHLALARAHLDRGDARMAQRQLERCAEVLRDQLGAPLGAAATALLDEAQRAASATVATNHAATATPAGDATSDAFPSVLASAMAGAMQGRDAESGAVRAAWTRALAGQASFAFLGGEPGVGKTTLAAHAARTCHDGGARVLFGRSDAGIDIPYQPFAEAFANWSAGSGDDARLAAQRAGFLPLLEPMTSGVARSTPGDPGVREAMRSELFDAMRAWLEHLASQRPTVLVLDDLHWADDATLSALRNVVRHPPAGPLLVVGTFRPEELHARHALRSLLADTRGDSSVFRVDVGGVDSVAVEAIVAASSPGPLPPAGAAFAASLHERTGGNPLFVHMTLRHLVDNGVVDPTAGRWSVEDPFAGASVAAGVSEVVERRLTVLPDGAVDAVRIAAVLGEAFDLRTLAAVLGSDEPELIASLAAASAAGLVGEVADEIDRYRFTHALVRDALEASVPRSRRVRVHWEAGCALEAMHDGDDRRLDEIAHHLSLGVAVGDGRRAALASIRAGRSSFDRLAFERARAHFTNALSLFDPERDPDLAWQALNGRGDADGALLVEGEGPSPDHLHAGAIARAQGWTDRLARSALGYAYFQMPGTDDRSALALLDDALAAQGDGDGDERLRCELLAARAMQCVVAGEAAAARASADESLSLARRVGEPGLVAAALSARCYVLLGSPAVEELRRVTAEAVSRPLPRAGRFIPAHFGLGVVAIQHGDRAGLRRAADEVRRAVDERESRTLAIFLPSWEAAVALGEGDFAGAHRHALVARDMSSAPAWRHAFEAHVIARRVELGREDEVVAALVPFVAQVPHARAQRCIVANLLMRRGDVAGARTHLGDLREREWVVDGWDSAICLRHLGEIAVADPDPEPEMLDELLAQAQAYRGQLLTSFTGVTVEAAADRVRGQVLLALGMWDEAVEAFDAARSTEDAFGARALAVRTGYWQARARLGVGDDARRAEAEALAGEALAGAKELGMAALVADLESLNLG